jgi:hypothetical protein
MSVTRALDSHDWTASWRDPRNSALDLLNDPSEAKLPDAKTLAWLKGRGISARALGSPRVIQVGQVQYLDHHIYAPNRLGEFALIFAVIDSGIIDLAAWSPRSGKCGTRRGIGACLGQGQIGRDGLGTHGSPLPVRRTPMGWLRAERTGIVVVDPIRAAHALAGINLVAEDAAHAWELRKTLQVPPAMILAPSTENRPAA